MKCTSCGMHSDNLREYSRAVDLGDHRKSIDTIFLCAACRVFNAINPKYLMKRVQHESRDEPVRWSSAGKQRVRERNGALSSGV